MGNKRNSRASTAYSSFRRNQQNKKCITTSPCTINSRQSACDSDDEHDEISGDEMDVECPNCGVFCRCRQCMLLQSEKSEPDDEGETDTEREEERYPGQEGMDQMSDGSESIRSVVRFRPLQSDEKTIFAIEIPSAATTDNDGDEDGLDFGDDVSEEDFFFDEDLMIPPLESTVEAEGLALEEVDQYELLFHAETSDSDDDEPDSDDDDDDADDDESAEDIVGWDCFLTDSDSEDSGSGATTDDEQATGAPPHAPPPGVWLCSPRTIVGSAGCGRAPPLLASWAWPCGRAYSLLDGSSTVYVYPPPPPPPSTPHTLPHNANPRTASPDLDLFFEIPPDSLSASTCPEHRDLRRWDKIPINVFRTRQLPSPSPRRGILKPASAKRRNKKITHPRKKKSRVAKRSDLLEIKSPRDFKGDTTALGIELAPLFGSFDV